MFTKLFLDVLFFHKKFKHFIATKQFTPVREVPYQVRKFRMERIHEEAQELNDAIASGDLKNIAREAIDLIYVVVGAMVIFGLPFEPLWDAVHAANMSKEFAGELEKPTKPPGWVSPESAIAKIYDEYLTAVEQIEGEPESAQVIPPVQHTPLDDDPPTLAVTEPKVDGGDVN